MKRNQYDWIYALITIVSFAGIGVMLAWRG